MKVSNRSMILIIVCLFALFFIGIPVWIYSANGNQSVQSDDLITVIGSIKNIRKTTTGGRNSNPIIYIKLLEYPYEFRIANSSYRVIDKDIVMKTLQKGTKVNIKTSIKEIKRSQSGSSLNTILKWRKQPLIYSLKTEHLNLMTIDQYNSEEKKLNLENIKWGIYFVLFVALCLIWEDYQERKNSVKF